MGYGNVNLPVYTYGLVLFVYMNVTWWGFDPVDVSVSILQKLKINMNKIFHRLLLGEDLR